MVASVILFDAMLVDLTYACLDLRICHRQKGEEGIWVRIQPDYTPAN
ncbi:MAG: hypothetical protein JSV77_09370 [Dehalococcoidales bacterium]|nr:MAG: hypothetical protein JSV77_09370 [Dehalococcoidales bacterium]